MGPSEPHANEEHEALLVVRDAGRRVEHRWLWRNLSFEIGAGARLGIAGPSGSGKTLLFRTLAALDRLDEGQIEYRGRPLQQWSLPQYRARVVYLMQTPALMEGSVRDNLAAVFELKAHHGRGFDEAKIVAYLQALGRDASLLRRPVEALSGGERQIVSFLRALQLQPEVLLLDEPTASLDAEAAGQIERLVEDWLAEDSGRATVWTSHHAAQLQRVTDRRIDLAG